jgi:hypothetical protein
MAAQDRGGWHAFQACSFNHSDISHSTCLARVRSSAGSCSNLGALSFSRRRGKRTSVANRSDRMRFIPRSARCVAKVISSHIESYRLRPPFTLPEFTCEFLAVFS